ncbi:unnamed protein product [Pleuronectes platessa]|uniref:Uncharacterized protein n=1 Tax=Pleuronectes platessa TaxID=8262 RepID=A0A9N7Y902_PLEPL|nr:unnamed protein product [Pleuronectes platessa]
MVSICTVNAQGQQSIGVFSMLKKRKKVKIEKVETAPPSGPGCQNPAEDDGALHPFISGVRMIEARGKAGTRQSGERSSDVMLHQLGDLYWGKKATRPPTGSEVRPPHSHNILWETPGECSSTSIKPTAHYEDCSLKAMRQRPSYCDIMVHLDGLGLRPALQPPAGLMITMESRDKVLSSVSENQDVYFSKMHI